MHKRASGNADMYEQKFSAKPKFSLLLILILAKKENKPKQK